MGGGECVSGGRREGEWGRRECEWGKRVCEWREESVCVRGGECVCASAQDKNTEGMHSDNMTRS